LGGIFLREVENRDRRIVELEARLEGAGGLASVAEPAISTLRSQSSTMLARLSQGPEEITLKDGRMFKNAKIISQTPATVMIQYPGGGVNIPKSLLPNKLLTQFPNTEGAVINGGASSRETTVGASGTDSIASSDFGVTEVERGSTITKFNWRVTFTNKSRQTVGVHPVLELRDKKNVKLDEERGADYFLQPGESHDFSELRLVSLEVWDQTDNFVLSVPGQIGGAKADVLTRDRNARAPMSLRREDIQLASTSEPLAAIKNKARAYADHHYRYEYLAGISGAVVTRLDISLEEPKQVNGLSERFAVEGDCSLEFYDSVAIGFNKKVADAFTITVEWTGNQAKVIDFSKHYAPR
jgi:hypothetical protein